MSMQCSHLRERARARVGGGDCNGFGLFPVLGCIAVPWGARGRYGGGGTLLTAADWLAPPGATRRRLELIEAEEAPERERLLACTVFELCDEGRAAGERCMHTGRQACSERERERERETLTHTGRERFRRWYHTSA
jgi:hypothetical protein